VPVVIAFGAAGAGLAIGGVFGALALGDASKAKDGCVDLACPPENEAFASSARSKAWVSNIGLGVAVAGVAVGIVLLLTRHSSKTGAKEGAHAGLDGAIHF
jgi:F0F1-type ATP synthase membrane subunit c/vacuolar-type H+-ATPase subunit K